MADVLDTIPDELVDWGGLLVSETEYQDKMNEILPLIVDGVSLEGKNQKYILFKAPTHGGRLGSNFRSLLLTLYHINLADQGSKMRTMRILSELVASLIQRPRKNWRFTGNFWMHMIKKSEEPLLSTLTNADK